MKPEIKKCLYDIRQAIDNISEYLGNTKDFQDFQQNLMLRRAVEREIEIIGEAVNRILKYEPEFPIENSRKIIATRNWVIHAYDNVDEIILWGIVTIHLPKLKEEVQQYLEKP